MSKRKSMKKQSVLTSTFIGLANPCTDGRELLWRYDTVRQAWLSKDATPTDMVWALCQSPDVTDKQIADLADALDKAQLLFSPYDRDDLVVDMATYPQERWECFPDLYNVEGRHADQANCKRAQQQRAVMRKAMPDAFKISDQDFKIKWEEENGRT